MRTGRNAASRTRYLAPAPVSSTQRNPWLPLRSVASKVMRFDESSIDCELL
ncbi:MAG: hypothetical protein RIQ93_3015, partial [Verrucomicrobiota bacterium]